MAGIALVEGGNHCGASNADGAAIVACGTANAGAAATVACGVASAEGAAIIACGAASRLGEACGSQHRARRQAVPEEPETNRRVHYVPTLNLANARRGA